MALEDDERMQMREALEKIRNDVNSLVDCLARRSNAPPSYVATGDETEAKQKDKKEAGRFVTQKIAIMGCDSNAMHTPLPNEFR